METTTIDALIDFIPAIILAIATVATLYYKHIRKDKEQQCKEEQNANNTKRKRVHKKKNTIIVVLIVLLVSSIAYSIYTQPTNEPFPSVTITSPSNNANVGMWELVSGTSQNIPEDSKVWVALRVGSRYYPQPEPMVDNDGRWTCNARFGGENDGGLTFEIIALVANKTAQTALTENNEFTVFPPDGAKEYAKITVTRENTTSITITSPANNAKVDMYQEVSGTSQNIPDGQKLWVVVMVDGLYFPHKVETINTDGTWRHNVQIGQENEDGKRFELVAVLADGSAQSIAQDWLKKKDTPEQYNLSYLPSGMTQYSTITVTRNSLEPSVTITSPANNANVNISEWVSGTSQNIPAGQQLWIVVHWDSLYFPMFDRVQINTDGKWLYNTTIGKEDDNGKVFEIIVVLADREAQAKVNEWYQNSYDLYLLPSGMTPYSTVTVTRR